MLTIECPCGASITMDDVSEATAISLVAQWHTYHIDHRHTIQEYMAKLDKIHPPRTEE